MAVITHSASLEQDELVLQSLKNICGDQDKGRVLRGKADDEYEAGFSLYQEEATGLFHLNSDETDKATREVFFVYRGEEGGALEIDWRSLREKNFRVRSARVLLVVQTILSEHVVSRGNKGYAIRRSGLLRVTERKVEGVFDLFTRYRDFDHLADELLGLSASVSINDHLGSPKDLRKWSVIREGMIVVFQPPWKVFLREYAVGMSFWCLGQMDNGTTPVCTGWRTRRGLIRRLRNRGLYDRRSQRTPDHVSHRVAADGEHRLHHGGVCNRRQSQELRPDIRHDRWWPGKLHNRNCHLHVSEHFQVLQLWLRERRVDHDRSAQPRPYLGHPVRIPSVREEI